MDGRLSRVENVRIPDEPAENDDQEAAKRYEQWISRDPFPEIPPALLTSADVYDYVRATGMISPFEQRLLKGASYKVSIGHYYIYWNGDGQKVRRSLGDGDEFYLEPNSIGFVTTKETFRLPHYIGARFNLRITNVHRGILLGTGPLVDPGFEGQLLVPLHNLTTNQYPFRAGEGFAWFEFTKVSPNYWDDNYARIRESHHLLGTYIPFPRRKTKLDPDRYLTRAYPGPIRSSIPEGFAQSQQSATKAQADADRARKDAERARNFIYGFGIIGGLAVFGTFIAVAVASWNLVSQVTDALTNLQERQFVLNTAVGALEQRTADVSNTLESLQDERLHNLEAHLEELIENVDVLSLTLGIPGAPPVQEQLEAVRDAISEIRAELDELRRQVGER